MSVPDSPAVVVPSVGLDGPDSDLFARLFQTWHQKRRRNTLRTVYYEGKNALRDFGIAVPPQMRSAYTPMQDIARGVHALTDRSQFEGFVSASGSADPFGLSETLDVNDFESEFPLATTSSAIHSCAFLTVTEGDTQSGEPDLLITPRAADASAAVWDKVRRRIGGYLAIMDTDSSSYPTEMAMFTPDRVYSFSKAPSGKWTWSWIRNRLGEVSVARLPLQPNMHRPFGNSRISRSSMRLTDAMIRTVLRAEVSAEFYAADKYWLFGADVTKFVGDDKWSAVMGRMNAIDIEEGDEISLQRFTGSSPQPHTEQLRMLKAEFAESMSLEVKFSDASNPSSADAIYAAKEELIMKTRNANRVWGRGAVKAMQLAVRLRDGLDAVPDELRTLSARFTDPAIVSPSARADAFSKLSATIPGFATSEVGMEFAGLSSDQIRRFKNEANRTASADRMTLLAEAARGLRDGLSGADSGVPAGESGSGGPGSGPASGLSQ